MFGLLIYISDNFLKKFLGIKIIGVSNKINENNLSP